MADPITLGLIGGVGSLLSGLFGGRSARKAQESAAQAQLTLGREQMAMGREIYDDQRDNANNALAAMYNVAGGTSGAAQQAINQAYGGQMGVAQDTRRDAMGFARNALNGQLNDFKPYAQAGGRANNALQFELGLGQRPAGYQGFQQTAGYQFARDQGIDAVQGSAAASGGLFSGRTGKALAQYGTGLANQYYGQHLDRLTGQQAMGLAASGAMAQTRGQFADRATNATNNYAGMAAGAIGDRSAGMVNTANNRGNAMMNALGMWLSGGQAAGNSYISNAGASNSLMANALANLGDARAAGAVGTANAITGGINNGLSLWSYLQNQNGGQGGAGV